MHTLDRQTDRKAFAIRALHYMQSHGKIEQDAQLSQRDSAAG